MADQEFAYGEEGVWHANRVSTKLYYFCDLRNCPLYHYKQKWTRQLLNNHRKTVHSLEPIEERKRGRPSTRITHSQPPAVTYRKSNNAKRKENKDYVLKSHTNAKRRRLVAKKCTEESVQVETELSEAARKHIFDIMLEYDSLENREKRWRDHVMDQHMKGEPVDHLLHEINQEEFHQEYDERDLSVEHISNTNEVVSAIINDDEMQVPVEVHSIETSHTLIGSSLDQESHDEMQGLVLQAPVNVHSTETSHEPIQSSVNQEREINDDEMQVPVEVHSIETSHTLIKSSLDQERHDEMQGPVLQAPVNVHSPGTSHEPYKSSINQERQSTDDVGATSILAEEGGHPNNGSLDTNSHEEGGTSVLEKGGSHSKKSPSTVNVDEQGCSSQDQGLITQALVDVHPKVNSHEQIQYSLNEERISHVQALLQLSVGQIAPIEKGQGGGGDGKPIENDCEVVIHKFQKGEDVFLLAIDGHKVGVGRVVNVDPYAACHFSQIGEGNVSIQVLESLDDAYELPISHPDATIMIEVVNGITRWPTTSLASILDGQDGHSKGIGQSNTSNLENEIKTSAIQGQGGNAILLTSKVTKGVPFVETDIPSIDGSMIIRTGIFFGGVDQRFVGGGNACSVLTLIIIDWLYQNPGSLPTKTQFDKLIKNGSIEYKKLCEEEYFSKLFPDGYFEMKTLLGRKIRPLTLQNEHSGWFQPPGLLEICPDRAAFPSFDTAWEEVTNGNHPSAVYIVAWDQHFFVLKVEEDAIYIIDTIGARLFQDNKKAFIMRTNRKTDFFVNGQLVCTGKEICKQYITYFLTADRLGELMEILSTGEKIEEKMWERLEICFMMIGYDQEASESTIHQAASECIKDQPKKKQTCVKPARALQQRQSYRRTFISPPGLKEDEKEEWKKDNVSLAKNKKQRKTIKK